MATPAQPLFDMSKATPIGGAAPAPLFDMSKATPIAAPATPHTTINDQIAHGMGADNPKPKPIDPPADHKEELVRSLAGDTGLGIYRQARDTVGKVENLLSSPSEAYDAARQEIRNIGATAKSNLVPEPYDNDPAHHVLRADVVPPVGVSGAIGDAAANESAVSGLAPKAAEPEVAANTPSKFVRNNPFRKPFASPKELAAAEAQPGAVTAIHNALGTDPETPILQGAKTVVDEPLSDLGTKKAAAYKQIDDTVGFDLKAEKAQLKDNQYAIKQPGVDKAAIQAEIDDSTKRIADAHAKLADADIDPKVADALNRSWEAGKQYKSVIARSTGADGTVDVNKLLNQSKAIRFTKNGDRLAQFFGKGDAEAGKAAADAYMDQLQAAQKTGNAFMKSRELRNTILKYAGYTGIPAAAAGAAYEVLK